MDVDFFNYLSSDNGFIVQAGLFMLLVLGGIGFPFPEDLTLFLGGVAIAKGIAPWATVALTCYVGVLIGDQLMYFIGYFFGTRLLERGTRSPFFPRITEEKVNEVRMGLHRHRLVYIFLARHLFPIRSMTFVIAGSLRISFVAFLVADAIAALVSVGIMVSLGYFLGTKLTPENLDHVAHHAQYYLGLAVILLAAIYWATKKYRNRNRLKL